MYLPPEYPQTEKAEGILMSHEKNKKKNVLALFHVMVLEGGWGRAANVL